MEAWPRLFHALRASRETELAAEYPIHVVTAWLGNTPRIAMKHYLMATESDFQRAATRTKNDMEKPMEYAPERVRNGKESPDRGIENPKRPIDVSATPDRTLQPVSDSYRKLFPCKELRQTERTGFEQPRKTREIHSFPPRALQIPVQLPTWGHWRPNWPELWPSGRCFQHPFAGRCWRWWSAMVRGWQTSRIQRGIRR